MYFEALDIWIREWPIGYVQKHKSQHEPRLRLRINEQQNHCGGLQAKKLHNHSFRLNWDHFCHTVLDNDQKNRRNVRDDCSSERHLTFYPVHLFGKMLPALPLSTQYIFPFPFSLSSSFRSTSLAFRIDAHEMCCPNQWFHGDNSLRIHICLDKNNHGLPEVGRYRDDCFPSGLPLVLQRFP